MSDADVLRCAADHIERVGLRKGGLGDYTRGTDPCCALGAILFCNRSPHWSGAEEAMRAHLAEKGLGQYIGRWNDVSTQAEVVAELRAAAAALDEVTP